jgi:hypothetical protein
MGVLKLFSRFLILIALVWAQIPTSVFAQLRQPTPACNMPCCAKEAELPKTQPQTTCKMCPTASSEVHVGVGSDPELPCDAIVSVPAGKDDCGCKLIPSSSPFDDSKTATLSIPSPNSLDFCDGWTPISFRLAPVDFLVRSPGITGADSGPPLHRPQCNWLGRAPPMFVA